LSTSGAATCYFSSNPTYVWRAQATSFVSTSSPVERIWIFLADTGLGAMASIDTPTTQNIAGFRFSTTAGDSYWQTVTSNGSSYTVTPTSVVPDSGVHRFKIVVNSGTNVKFYIDDLLVNTMTLTLPTGSAGVFGTCCISNTAGGSAVTTMSWYNQSQWTLNY